MFKNTLKALCLQSVVIIVFTGPILAAETNALRPNIVYVLADEWRASATGYAGDPNVKTPNLDRLAAQSWRFRNAVSTQPVCTAHRASLQTGRFPTTTGMFLNDAHLPDEELCMAEIFDAAGYTTGYIGKWHLDGHGRTAYIPPERRQGWQWWRGNECTHVYNHSAYYEGDSSVKKFWPGYDAYEQTKAAQGYLRDHTNSSQPFVLMICYGPPHFPTTSAPIDLKALYPPESIILPANVTTNWIADALVDAQGYYAHCTALDSCVGEIMQTLDETGLAENTILVFTADHGESLGSHDIKPFKKQAFWNETAGVPFLMRYPAVHGNAGRDISMPITTTDVLPTLLGFAGVEKPKSLEGGDVSPILRAGLDDAERTALYMNVYPAESDEYRALRSGRYTFARFLDGQDYLFDNVTDPLQMTNLIATPDFVGVRDDLTQRLASELARIRDPFLPGSVYLSKWYPTLQNPPIPYNNDGTTPVVTPTAADSDGDGMKDDEELTAGRNPYSAADLGFEFNTDGVFEGWGNFSHITNQAVSGGIISGTSSTLDPIFSRSDFSFDGNSVSNIVVKIRLPAPDTVQFFWGRSGATGFSSARRVEVPYLATDVWQRVTFPLATNTEWRGQTITSLRIDPGMTTDKTFAIDWLRAVDGDPNLFEISSASVTNGLFSMNITGQGGVDYVVQTSTNLATWLSVWTNTSTLPPFLFTDGTTNSNQHFYRVLMGP